MSEKGLRTRGTAAKPLHLRVFLASPGDVANERGPGTAILGGAAWLYANGLTLRNGTLMLPAESGNYPQQTCKDFVSLQQEIPVRAMPLFSRVLRHNRPKSGRFVSNSGAKVVDAELIRSAVEISAPEPAPDLIPGSVTAYKSFHVF